MFVEHDGAQLYAASFGSASRTLVGLGGWAGSWELWAEPFAILSETWRTIGYDHRGTGATVAAPASINLDSMVGDLFAILDFYKVEKCVLAAESAGGATALHAVLQHPERFVGLVLVDAMYYRSPSTEPDSFLFGLEHAFESTMHRFVDSCLTANDSEAIRLWGRKIVGRCSQDAAIVLHESMNGIDLRPQLAEVEAPTLVIHGAQDQIVAIQSSQLLASSLRNGRLHIIEGAGHVPTVTHAAEVAAAINAFFADLI